MTMLTNFTAVMLDNRMVYFTSAATIRHLSEIFLKEIKV
jgi:hypothetical protein